MVAGIIVESRKLGEYGRFAVGLLLAAVMLYLAADLAVIAHVNTRYSPLYPATGIALALLWLHGIRYWPAVFLSSALLNARLGSEPLIACGSGCLDLLVPLLALYLLKRWQVRPTLERTRDLVGFGVAILAGSALSLPLYTLLVATASHMPLAAAALFGLHFFLASLLGALAFTPVLTVGLFTRPWDRQRLWPVTVSLAAIGIIAWVLLGLRSEFRDQLLFVIMPFVIVCAVTDKVRGASLAACLVGLVIIAVEAKTAATVFDVSLRELFVGTLAVTGYLLAVVTGERERSAEELIYRARHDLLTDLINRYEFENQLRLAIQDASQRYALLYIDLDQFKLVNDTCGHLAGDDMLRRLAGALAHCLPAGAALARLGGDEFGCLLACGGDTEAATAAEGIHQAIRGFRFEVGELSFTVGASIGVAWIEPGRIEKPGEVLGRADFACYTAKEQGRNRTYFYSPSDAAVHRRHADLNTLSQLQAALTGGHFALYLQRIANIGDAQDARPFYEVLLRYAKPEDGRTVKDILDNAQRYGLLAQVDRWVFERAALFLQQNPGQGIKLSVNVTATTLESDGFEKFVQALPRRHGFDAAQMCIEITEVVAVQNLEGAVGVLQRLRQQGFDIALDDFGTGVASFGYLSQLPVTMVKIDGHFVRELGQDPAAGVVIESLARIAALRQIPCIAEWVEDAAAIPLLRQLGVRYAQGYAIHRPVPMASMGETGAAA